MRVCFILLLLVSTSVFFTECKKNDNDVTATMTTGNTNTTNASQKPNLIVSQGLSTLAQNSPYPYSDAYSGQYSEVLSGTTVPIYAGSSTVAIQHLSADSIRIYTGSLGIPIGAGFNLGFIDIRIAVNDSNIYKFATKPSPYGAGGYTCKLTNDSLVCIISQAEPTGCAEYNEYAGTFTGYKRQ
jgi:hypothetical protein